MYINIKDKNGFTLVETIVGISLGILVITTIMTVVTLGMVHIKAIKNLEKLHSNAIFLVNALNYWIKQAETLDVASSPGSPVYDILNIEFPDSSTTTIKKLNDSIVIGNTPSTTPDIEVQELVFTKMARSVRIGFKIKAAGSNETFSATTTIAQRNKP